MKEQARTNEALHIRELISRAMPFVVINGATRTDNKRTADVQRNTSDASGDVSGDTTAFKVAAA